MPYPLDHRVLDFDCTDEQIETVVDIIVNNETITVSSIRDIFGIHPDTEARYFLPHLINKYISIFSLFGIHADNHCVYYLGFPVPYFENVKVSGVDLGFISNKDYELEVKKMADYQW